MEVIRHAELIVEWFLWTIEHTNSSLDNSKQCFAHYGLRQAYNNTFTSHAETTLYTGLSQLLAIVIAVVACTVLLTLLVVVMVALATAFCRRWGKEQVYRDYNANRGVRFQVTNMLNSTAYYELMSLDMDHAHSHHQILPFHTPQMSTT